MARRRSRRLPAKKWTMLAYIAGDNNLSDNGLEDIQEMCDVGASRTGHVGVQIDTDGEHDGAIRYEISEPDPTGTAHRVVIERLPESDSGNPEVLYEFLHWASAGTRPGTGSRWSGITGTDSGQPAGHRL
jgi:hypothetical protein